MEAPAVGMARAACFLRASVGASARVARFKKARVRALSAGARSYLMS